MPPTTDVFRPHLPFDPFASLERGPWHPAISQHADPPSAVLVLGEPSRIDLDVLLYGPSLTSLLLIATHAPPYIHQQPTTAVRILRLATSLAQDTSALRLVGLLERADRVVRRYRMSGQDRRGTVIQYAENPETAEFDVEEQYSLPSPSTPKVAPRYPSPAPSSASSLSSSSSSSSLSRRQRGHRLPASRPPQDRAFDAIINFLPSSLPDKFLLKHAILVSTLTASFISAPPAPHTSPKNLTTTNNTNHKRTSIFSTFSFSSSDAHVADAEPAKNNYNNNNPSRPFSTFLRRDDNHPPPPPSLFIHSAPSSQLSLSSTSKGKSRSHSLSQRKAHLIHVLPSRAYHNVNARKSKPSRVNAKPKLVESIEQFLLAYGYPLQSMSIIPPPSPTTSGGTFMSIATGLDSSLSGGGESKPIPYLIPSGVFGSIPTGGSGGKVLTIGEILLLGGFDRPQRQSHGGMGDEEGRVWIGSPDDVVWDDEDGTASSIDHTRSHSREVAPQQVQIPSPTHSPSSSYSGTSWTASKSKNHPPNLSTPPAPLLTSSSPLSSPRIITTSPSPTQVQKKQKKRFFIFRSKSTPSSPTTTTQTQPLPKPKPTIPKPPKAVSPSQNRDRSSPTEILRSSVMRRSSAVPSSSSPPPPPPPPPASRPTSASHSIVPPPASPTLPPPSSSTSSSLPASSSSTPVLPPTTPTILLVQPTAVPSTAASSPELPFSTPSIERESRSITTTTTSSKISSSKPTMTRRLKKKQEQQRQQLLSLPTPPESASSLEEEEEEEEEEDDGDVDDGGVEGVKHKLEREGNGRHDNDDQENDEEEEEEEEGTIEGTVESVDTGITGLTGITGITGVSSTQSEEEENGGRRRRSKWTVGGGGGRGGWKGSLRGRKAETSLGHGLGAEVEKVKVKGKAHSTIGHGHSRKKVVEVTATATNATGTKGFMAKLGFGFGKIGRG